jgi:tetratricopeptide (TPR) repeat protein
MLRKGVHLAKKGDFKGVVEGETPGGKRMYWLGSSLVMLGRYEEGIARLDQALTMLKSDGAAKEKILRRDALYALGYAHNALRKWNLARTVLTEAVALTPASDALEHAKGLNHLAAATLHCGDTSAAAVLIAESLTLLSSKNIDAKSQSASIKARALLVQAETLRAKGSTEESKERGREALAVAQARKGMSDAKLVADIEEFLRARPSRIKGIIVGGLVAAFVVGGLAAIAM